MHTRTRTCTHVPCCVSPCQGTRGAAFSSVTPAPGSGEEAESNLLMLPDSRLPWGQCSLTRDRLRGQAWQRTPGRAAVGRGARLRRRQRSRALPARLPWVPRAPGLTFQGAEGWWQVQASLLPVPGCL